MQAQRLCPPILALARKNETTTSQTTVLLAAANMWGKSRVCVARPTDAPSRAQAPLGRGDRMNPQIIHTNRDSKLQACAGQEHVRVVESAHKLVGG